MIITTPMLRASAAFALLAALMAPLAAETGMPGAQVRAMAGQQGTGLFFTDDWRPSLWRSSEVAGMAVYNRAGERIGAVDELLIDASGLVMAAVIGVGGFLGIGERNVAISYQSMEMLRDGEGKPRLLVDLQRQTLESAPEYKPLAKPRRG